MFETKIFQAVASFVRLRHHLRRPRSEVLDPAHLYTRIMDVNPVVVKSVAILENEHDGEKITILERVGRAFRFFRNLG